MEKKFCLLDEYWILALDNAGKIIELSLMDVFRRAHELKRLSGELPTQDAAIIRFSLAVIYAVFTRVDADSTESPLDNESQALERWRGIWQAGRFPVKPIENYLANFACDHQKFL